MGNRDPYSDSVSSITREAIERHDSRLSAPGGERSSSDEDPTDRWGAAPYLAATRRIRSIVRAWLMSYSDTAIDAVKVLLSRTCATV